MQGNLGHLSDEELLLFSDQELAPKPAARAREHVAQCGTCRERLNGLEVAASDFADLHGHEVQTLGSDSLAARNLLRVRLSEASTRRSQPRPATFGNILTRQLASACLALLLVVSGTWAVRQMLRARSSSGAMSAQATILPRRTLTPGSTRAVALTDICSTQDVDNDPPVNARLQKAVFSEYGVSASAERNYALDYLISPSLGGVDSIQNLWPQPSSSIWNARVKDQLEDHLHEMVCQGKVQLTTAQNDIATDWIAAYKRYFNTDKPEPGLPATAALGSSDGLEPRRREQIEVRTLVGSSLSLVAVFWRPTAFSAATYPRW